MRPTDTPLGFALFLALLLISLGTFGYLMESRLALLAWGDEISGRAYRKE